MHVVPVTGCRAKGKRLTEEEKEERQAAKDAEKAEKQRKREETAARKYAPVHLKCTVNCTAGVAAYERSQGEHACSVTVRWLSM